MLLLRVLHKVRYFTSVASNATEQKEMITALVNLILKKNATKGRGRKAPLDWTECHKLVDYIAAKFRKSMARLYDTDPYT